MSSTKELFNLFTAAHEYNPFIRDKWDRFPYYISDNQNIFKPLVSKEIYKRGFQPKYPGNKSFCVVLSHDVDMIYENQISTRKFAKEFLYNQNFLLGDYIRSLKTKLYKSYNKAWHLSHTVNIEKEYNATSSFYFLATDKGQNDFNYNLKEAKPLFDLVKGNNCEIGLHGSLYAYNDFDKIAREKERLSSISNYSITGYRNHVLKFKVPNTWKLLEEAGFIYDTTFGHGEVIGFRNGMCYPFNPYDLNDKRFIKVLELPLNIMDVSLFSQYMRLDFKVALKICQRIIDEVIELNGVITILWHNNFMLGEMGQFYEELLKYCFNKNAWMTNGQELSNWWMNNDYDKNIRDLILEYRNEY